MKLILPSYKPLATLPNTYKYIFTTPYTETICVKAKNKNMKNNLLKYSEPRIVQTDH